MSILEELATLQASNLATALASYRLILANNASPGDTDAATLVTLMASLGLSNADVAADVAAFDEAAQLAVTADGLSDAETAEAAATAAVTAYKAAHIPITAAQIIALGALKQTVQAAKQTVRTCKKAASDLADLVAANPRALGS